MIWFLFSQDKIIPLHDCHRGVWSSSVYLVASRKRSTLHTVFIIIVKSHAAPRLSTDHVSLFTNGGRWLVWRLCVDSSVWRTFVVTTTLAHPDGAGGLFRWESSPIGRDRESCSVSVLNSTLFRFRYLGQNVDHGVRGPDSLRSCIGASS